MSARYTSATPPEEQDGPMLSVGSQCSEDSCILVDFLPLKCQHCSKPFCSEHYIPQSHKCGNFDASKHDRVAPSCSLCNTPVAIPPGEDPNLRMERHISSECSVTTGKNAKKSSPVCGRPRCGKLLFAPIKCDKCSQQFCPQHRYPSEHTCQTTGTTAPASKAGHQATKSLANASKQTSAASNAAVAAIKRSLAPGSSNKTTESSKPSSSQAPSAVAPTTSKSTASHSNPFSRVDRSSSVYAHHPGLSSAVSAANATLAAMANPTDDNDAAAPPARCSPKPSPASISLLNSNRGFAPRPLFGTA